MTNLASPSSSSPSRTKIAAVVLLAVVFVAVLVSRFRSDGNSLATTVAAKPVSVSKTLVREPAATEGRPESDQTLPTIDLERLTAFNPFHPQRRVSEPRPAVASAPRVHSFPQPLQPWVEWARERWESFLDPSRPSWPELTVASESGGVDATPIGPEVVVSAIITGGNRPAALIGGRLYFENDPLDERWRVVAIRSERVIIGRVTE